MAVKILFIIGGALVILAAAILARTLRYGPPPLPPAEPARNIGIDIDGAAGRLGGAVRFRTVSSQASAPAAKDAFLGLHDYLAEHFPRVRSALRRETVNQFSLLYTWPGRDENLPPILLTAHLDVVPVEEGTEAAWTHPPFAGAVRDGFVWGRGTLDVKQSALAMLEAAEFLIAAGFRPERTVYFAFGHDEEIGGKQGAAAITRLLGRRAKRMAFSLDEGLAITQGIIPGLAKPAALIGIGEKGYASFRLTSRGPGGHSSRPLARTVIGRLGRALGRLESGPMPARLISPGAELFRYLAPNLPFAQRMVLANRWLFDGLLLRLLAGAPASNALIRTTTAPTMVTGGTKENILPQAASAVINARLLPGDSLASVQDHLARVIDDPEIALDLIGGNAREASAISDPASPAFALLVKTIRQVFPDVAVAPGLVIGGTDSKHYAKIADHSFRFVPIRLTRDDLKRLHGTDERISVKNYGEIIRFYVRLLENTAAKGR